MPRCAVCLVELVKGEPHPLYKDEFIVHKHCATGTPVIRLELAQMTRERTAYKNQVDQANRNARATMDQAHKVEADVFKSNAAVHQRVSELEAALATERALRTAAELALQMARRLPPPPAPPPAPGNRLFFLIIRV